jgi:uncharacterized protein
LLPLDKRIPDFQQATKAYVICAMGCCHNWLATGQFLPVVLKISTRTPSSIACSRGEEAVTEVVPMALMFLDTSILLCHLLQDDPIHSPKASAFLKRIEEGAVKVRTSDTVIFETVFTLQKEYRQPKQAISDALLPLLELPGIVLPQKRRYRKVFSLYVERNLPFDDAYHAVLMEHLNLTEIVSFDADFDKRKGRYISSYWRAFSSGFCPQQGRGLSKGLPDVQPKGVGTRV